MATFGARSRQLLVAVTRTPDGNLTGPARPEVGRSEVDAVPRPHPGAGALYEDATDCMEHLRQVLGQAPPVARGSVLVPQPHRTRTPGHRLAHHRQQRTTACLRAVGND